MNKVVKKKNDLSLTKEQKEFLTQCACAFVVGIAFLGKYYESLGGKK